MVAMWAFLAVVARFPVYSQRIDCLCIFCNDEAGRPPSHFFFSN